MAGEYTELSLVVLEWQAQALAQGREEGRAKGWEEGRAKGWAEGRAEARVEILELQREQLLALLRTKSPSELPADLLTVVQGQSDLSMLRRWFNRALLVSSAEELRSTFGLS